MDPSRVLIGGCPPRGPIGRPGRPFPGLGRPPRGLCGLRGQPVVPSGPVPELPFDPELFALQCSGVFVDPTGKPGRGSFWNRPGLVECVHHGFNAGVPREELQPIMKRVVPLVRANMLHEVRMASDQKKLFESGYHTGDATAKQRVENVLQSEQVLDNMSNTAIVVKAFELLERYRTMALYGRRQFIVPPPPPEKPKEEEEKKEDDDEPAGKRRKPSGSETKSP